MGENLKKTHHKYNRTWHRQRMFLSHWWCWQSSQMQSYLCIFRIVVWDRTLFQEKRPIYLLMYYVRPPHWVYNTLVGPFAPFFQRLWPSSDFPALSAVATVNSHVVTIVELANSGGRKLSKMVKMTDVDVSTSYFILGLVQVLKVTPFRYERVVKRIAKYPLDNYRSALPSDITFPCFLFDWAIFE